MVIFESDGTLGLTGRAWSVPTPRGNLGVGERPALSSSHQQGRARTRAERDLSTLDADNVAQCLAEVSVRIQEQNPNLDLRRTIQDYLSPRASSPARRSHPLGPLFGGRQPRVADVVGSPPAWTTGR